MAGVGVANARFCALAEHSGSEEVPSKAGRAVLPLVHDPRGGASSASVRFGRWRWWLVCPGDLLVGQTPVSGVRPRSPVALAGDAVPGWVSVRPGKIDPGGGRQAVSWSSAVGGGCEGSSEGFGRVYVEAQEITVARPPRGRLRSGRAAGRSAARRRPAGWAGVRRWTPRSRSLPTWRRRRGRRRWE